jgi:hypothetical protein
MLKAVDDVIGEPIAYKEPKPITSFSAFQWIITFTVPFLMKSNMRV